jgi:hypothetical protein
VVVVETIPGGLNQAALQLALSTALAAGGSDASGGSVTSVSGLGSAAIKEVDANSATYAFSKDNYFVVISITSSKNSGAAMDSQVEAPAQTAAGQLRPSVSEDNNLNLAEASPDPRREAVAFCTLQGFLPRFALGPKG